MAEAMGEVECEFCCSKSDSIVNPKVLPCNHVHCMDCLTTYYESKHLLLCGHSGCGKVFEIPPESLPSYDLGSDKSLCDVCLKKSSKRDKAVRYCTECCKKFCSTHLQSHDDVMDEHHKITFLEFLAGEQKAKVGKCPDHKDQRYILGCGKCHVISCLKCVPNLPACDFGAAHTLAPLEDLAETLLTGKISAESAARDVEYERLFKKVSKLHADYDSQTEAMLDMIHQKRDAQMNSLQEQYNELEKKVLETRQKSKLQITDFLEDVLLNNWRKLRNQREILETKIKHSPPDDIVRGFKELKQQMDKFIVEELPRLEVGGQYELRQRDIKYDIGLEIVPSESVIVASDQESPGPQRNLRQSSVPLPTSITLLTSIQLSSRPLAICQHKGITYVGLGSGTVSRIDSNLKLSDNFISCPAAVDSISVHNDSLYILSGEKVTAFDLSGQTITTWQHPCYEYYSNSLTEVAGNIVVADPDNSKVIIYSPTGERLRSLRCDLLSKGTVSICAGYGTDVVLTDYNKSLVFRFDTADGIVPWKHADVKLPNGLVFYGDYVLVSEPSSPEINVLKYDTGDKVAEIADDTLRGCTFYSLSVTGNTLAAPDFASCKLLLYQLNHE